VREEPIVAAIVGATATGKSDLAVAVAEALGGEVVSVDSRLIYRGMDIGTAKPTRDQRQRVPHHLIDVADPDETWSVARYRQSVLALIPEIAGRRRVPILVGGTGQYMRAILQGWVPPPSSPDPEVRARLEAEWKQGHGDKLVERLWRIDPGSAERIDLRNSRRVIRALEIYEATGVPASALRRSQPPAFHAVQVGLRLPRAELYARIDARIDRMVESGLVEEVRRLLARGYSRSLPSMSAIGYREIASHLEGEIGLEQAVRLMRQATRLLVRRQANWFRESDPSVKWSTPEAGYEVAVVEWLRGAIAGFQGASSSPEV